MANDTDPLASNTQTLLNLLGLFTPSTQTQTDQGGTTTVTGGGTISSSGSSSGGYGYEQTILTQEAVNRLLQQIMESNTGLTSVAQGQKNAGLYNSSTMQMLINDLMARAAGEVAVKGAKTEKVTPRSSQSSSSSPASNVVTTTRTPSTSTSTRQAPLAGGNGSLAASLLALGSLANNKKIRELLGGTKDLFFPKNADAPSWTNLTSNQGFDNLMSSLGITSVADSAGNLSFSPNITENPIISQLLGDNTEAVNSLFGIGPVSTFGQDAATTDALGSLITDTLSSLGSIDMPYANIGDLGELGGGLANVDTSGIGEVIGDVLDGVAEGVDAVSDGFDFGSYGGSVIGGVLGGLLNDGNLSVDEARGTAINTVGNAFTYGGYGALNTLTGGALTDAIAPVVEGAENVGFNLLAATDPMFDFINSMTGISSNIFGIDTSPGHDFIGSILDPFDIFDDGCFITTAVCGVMGLEDNCNELTVLRQFRDTWLKITHPEDIAVYYATAPDLVRKLNSLTTHESVYANLYHKFIRPAVVFIEQGSYEAAYETYKQLYNHVKHLAEGV